MPDAASERIDQLVLRHLDGALSDSERVELMAALRGSATARQTLSERAWQHTALPGILDAGGVSGRKQVQPAPPIPFMRRLRPWLIAASIALALLLPALIWRGDARSHEVRLLANQTGERWLQAGERITAPAGGARLSWAGEATELHLMPGTLLTIEQLGASKVLNLASGRLSAEVAPQAAGRNLIIRTPFGTATVVGTRFSLSVEPDSVRLSVRRGLVRFAADGQLPGVNVQAGFAVQADAQGVGMPTPLTGVSTPARAAFVVDRALFDADRGQGWRGIAVDGGIAAVPDVTAEIVLAPERQGRGYGIVRDDTQFSLRCAVTTATTVAIIVVCQDAESGDWRLNLIGDRPVSPGTHQVSWSTKDLKGVGGASQSLAIGCRIGWIGVMSWEPAKAGLVVHRLDIDEPAAAARGGF